MIDRNELLFMHSDNIEAQEVLRSVMARYGLVLKASHLFEPYEVTHAECLESIKQRYPHLPLIPVSENN